MSWFKKIFSSQSSSERSSQSSPQEPKVYFTKQKSQTEEPDKEPTDITVSEFKECDETTQSTQNNSCYSWSGVSQSFDIKGEKRGWSDDEENKEPWWESFKSQSPTQKSGQKSESFKLSQPSSSQTQTEASQYQSENASDQEEQDEGEKISFYLKLGKHKKIKFMWFCILETTKVNDVNRNCINNFLYHYSIKDNEENFKIIAEVITKREYFVYRKILYIINNCRVAEEDSGSITVEIDLVEHRYLLEDITKKFFTKKLQGKSKKKLGMRILLKILS